MVAYFTQDTVDYLRTVDDLPHLASISVPPGKYKTARSGNRGRSHPQGFEADMAESSLAAEYPAPRHPPTTSLPVLHRSSAVLAPLEYLKNIPPHRRHPIDEEALMSLAKKPAWIH
ncbi:hypothetical protein H0H81_012598 [Sphagnurus paluster]|uniref:Uncharacterized protein n=1 Tax=Sphagnurus paluster TaxID=117069 RepID=A0A9P7GPB3_9AGAR|nr:hypothetical protein H0H81_012598 [Sphagnurus paluster]